MLELLELVLPVLIEIHLQEIFLPQKVQREMLHHREKLIK